MVWLLLTGGVVAPITGGVDRNSTPACSAPGRCGSLPSRGAWIETSNSRLASRLLPGRSPHGGRGLKLLPGYDASGRGWSLPSRGAWIETGSGPLTVANQIDVSRRAASMTERAFYPFSFALFSTITRGVTRRKAVPVSVWAQQFCCEDSHRTEATVTLGSDCRL